MNVLSQYVIAPAVQCRCPHAILTDMISMAYQVIAQKGVFVQALR
jgi:hypothetical protein